MSYPYRVKLNGVIVGQSYARLQSAIDIMHSLAIGPLDIADIIKDDTNGETLIYRFKGGVLYVKK